MSDIHQLSVEEALEIYDRLKRLEEAVFKKPPGPPDHGVQLEALWQELKALQNQSSTDRLKFEQSDDLLDKKIDRVLRVVAQLLEIVKKQSPPDMLVAEA